MTIQIDFTHDGDPFTRRWDQVPRVGDHIKAQGQWWIVTAVFWQTALDRTATDEQCSCVSALVACHVKPVDPWGERKPMPGDNLFDAVNALLESLDTEGHVLTEYRNVVDSALDTYREKRAAGEDR